jgi:hypothetical protein
MDAYIKPVILSCPDSVQCELRQGFQGVSSLEVFRLKFNLLNETGEATVSSSKRILLYGGTWLVINLYFCFDTLLLLLLLLLLFLLFELFHFRFSRFSYHECRPNYTCFLYSTSQVINSENVHIWSHCPHSCGEQNTLNRGLWWELSASAGFPFILLISCLYRISSRCCPHSRQITEVPLNSVIPQVASSKYWSYVTVSCVQIWILNDST